MFSPLTVAGQRIGRSFARFEALVERCLPAAASEPPPPEAVVRKLFFWFCGGWLLLWSVLPIISLDNDFVDILENIVWGRHFQFGYDKNPYIGAWLGHFFYRLSGKSLWINYFLSQLFVLTGLVSVWKLSRRLLPAAGASVAALLLLPITFYGMKAVELCDDVIELGLWPLTILFFYQALRDKDNWYNWPLVGVFAGLSFMTKYYGAVLFASMGLVLLVTPEGRNSFKHAGIYLAALIFILISAPNMLWLWQNGFVAVNYAMGRANLQPELISDWKNHLDNPLWALNRAFGVIVVPLAIFLVLFFRRDPQRRKQNAFDRRFVSLLCWGPFGLTLMFSFISGASINYSWVVPCFPLLGLFCVFLYQPKIDRLNFRLFLGVIVIVSVVFAVIFAVRSLYYQGYRKRGCDYENYPGKLVSQIITADWRRRFGTSLGYVIGERLEACNVALYSPDLPQAYFSANPAFSQWIDETDIRRRGAVILWTRGCDRAQRWLKRFRNPESGFSLTPVVEKDYPRAVPGWFRTLIGRPPKTVAIYYCFIIPREKS
ncbi:MAG: glycosyltransferase family 39 protein [Victivallaceae bacterium]|nr:glycosyltransferase family 39 protein [Victivallaceae bacterium]